MSIFTKTVRSKLPSNEFRDLSYSNKFDMQIGLLYPVHVEEIVPGDIFFSGHGAMVRSQPLVNPVFHNFNYNVRWFFVPNRLVWENFESFITDQEKGKKQVGLENPHVHPYLNDESFAQQKSYSYIHDLMGVSPLDGDDGTAANRYIADYVAAGLKIDALPFRAYTLIWNEYFRDENTMDSVEFPLTDGSDFTRYDLLRVSWKKDYFTSALPFAQRGEAVQLLGRVVLGDAPYSPQVYRNLQGTGAGQTTAQRVAVGALGGSYPSQALGTGTNESTVYGQVVLDPSGNYETAIEFNAIRRANALQRFLERSALGGNRYAELLLAHFGVRSSDASLQRPEYLGGGVCPINISPVEQTSSTDSSSPQGNLAGKGVGVGSMYFNKRTLFTEHGWLIGVAFIRPDADYINGIRRQLIKTDRYDYFWPDFQNIGEQEIHNWELWASTDPSDNEGTFGYQSRYSEYKWHGNEVHGMFRSSLKSWVAPRAFNSLPTLSQEFIECNLDIANNMAVSPEKYPPFMVEGLNVVHARRPMYYFNRGTL